MWRKPYGSTGKEITVVGFGGMRFANAKDIDANAEVVLYAHAKGINYFDTAPGYCGDNSEKILGAAFKQMPRDSFYCSTKCGDPDGAVLRRTLETSLERMNVDWIDFFHIWCIVRPEEWQQRKDGGAIPEAIKAKEEGLIRHLVTSVHLSGEEACKVLGEDFIEGVTLPYNALNFPFRSEALDFAARRNIGVVTMNPLGGGLIPNNPQRMAFLKGPNDRNVVEAAIRFNISHPAVTCALVGFTTKDHVDQAVAAVEDFQPYPPEHVERVKANVEASFDGLCTMCGYCQPCPAELEIPKLMEAYNWQILQGGDQSIANRLRWHWNMTPGDAAGCIDCGQCEEKCTQHLPIRDRLKEIADLGEKG
ncbi:MAG TPA: aldo/keto reductase [Phycisphaerae bacterium]|nr:aldo/keto reductase [Phycisphaerae bacterium]